MKVRLVWMSKTIAGTSLLVITIKEIQHKEEIIKLEYHFSITAKIMDLDNHYQ